MGKKKSKMEKEVRRLVEATTDMTRKKNGTYRFKGKNKKRVKKIKKKCVHWIIRKGKEVPTTIQDPAIPGNWKCTLCGHSFPIKPLSMNEYQSTTRQVLSYVDQMLFWSVKLGGDMDDTKMFLSLKENLPRFEKVTRTITKRLNKIDSFEKNRSKSNALDQFNNFSAFNYKP